MCWPQVTMLEQAVIQKDSELRAAAASQREAGEALRRSGARAQKLEQDVAALQARCLELQRAQSAVEEQQSDALLQLRQQVGPSAKTGPSSIVFFWELCSLTYMKSWSGTWRRCRRTQAYSCSKPAAEEQQSNAPLQLRRHVEPCSLVLLPPPPFTALSAQILLELLWACSGC